jgi:hypothetical protein
MDCRTGKGERVKVIRIRNSGGKVNAEKKKRKKNTPGIATTKSSVCLVKVLEFFLRCPILVLVYKQEL